MNSNKERSPRQSLRIRQKTKLKIVIAGGCIFTLTIILLIYFNLTRVEEMKARENTGNTLIERPADMNVAKIKIDHAATNQRDANYKIAKQLTQDKQN